MATEDPTFIISQIFYDAIEIDYNKQIRIDSSPYRRTSRQYRELKDYYGQIFTGEALEWIMSTKFADVDGMLYCSVIGGASGRGFKFLSLEKLQENTYKGTYLTYHSSVEGEEENTIFEVEKNDAGYRISSIDYCPPFLNR